MIPSGLSTNTYERPIWKWLIHESRLVRLLDFENRLPMFPDVDSRMKFSVLVLTAQRADSFDAACWLTSVHEVKQVGRVARLTLADLREFSPETLALPQFRCERDLHLLRIAHRTHRSLRHSWDLTPRLMFSTSDEAFNPVPSTDVEVDTAGRTVLKSDARTTVVRVYEGKMVGILDHRQADVVVNPANRFRQAQEQAIPDAEKEDALRFARCAQWVPEASVRSRRFTRTQGDWELVFCDVTSATNERTAIAAIVPLSGLTRSLPALYLRSDHANQAAVLVGLMSTFVFDYFCRLKVAGNHLTQEVLASIPIPAMTDVAIWFADTWVKERVLELTYTSRDLDAFAAEFGLTEPFRWDLARRTTLFAELHAAAFHLYGIAREDVDYIMETFPIVRRNDDARFGEYRTKRLVLEIYDRMQQAKDEGIEYQTILEPPPADPRVAHHARESPPSTWVVPSTADKPEGNA